MRTWEFPPLRIKSLFESNPLKSKLLVGGLGVPAKCRGFVALLRKHRLSQPPVWEPRRFQEYCSRVLFRNSWILRIAKQPATIQHTFEEQGIWFEAWMNRILEIPECRCAAGSSTWEVLKGSATKGRFRKCGPTVFLFKLCINRILEIPGSPYLPYSTFLWNRSGAVFGCFCRLRVEETISQNWLKGQNIATMKPAIFAYHKL